MTTMSSQRQPVYRRPSWAQKESSYKLYMRKDLAADRSPGNDFGLENFSYDEAHVSRWQMPSDLAKHVRGDLDNAVTEWKFAGAAVCTALDRIQKLDNDSLYRGYPDKSRSPYHQMSRRASHQSSALMGADTPPMSSPMSPTPMLPASLLSLDKMSFDGLPQRSMIGMESPPFTPADTQTCPTPDVPNIEKGLPPGAFPDAHMLARQLSPISTMSTMSHDSGISTGSAFDENAWDVFMNTYKAELQDIRQEAWARFKGAGYTIDRIRVELGQNQQNHDMLEAFNKWWAEMKPKVREYEEKVRQLQEPTIELIRMERAAQGLPI